MLRPAHTLDTLDQYKIVDYVLSQNFGITELLRNVLSILSYVKPDESSPARGEPNLNARLNARRIILPTHFDYAYAHNT